MKIFFVYYEGSKSITILIIFEIFIQNIYLRLEYNPKAADDLIKLKQFLIFMTFKTVDLLTMASINSEY